MTDLQDGAERYYDRIETGRSIDASEGEYVWASHTGEGVGMKWFGGEYADVCALDEFGLPSEAFTVTNMYGYDRTPQGPFDEEEIRVELANAIVNGMAGYE